MGTKCTEFFNLYIPHKVRILAIPSGYGYEYCFATPSRYRYEYRY